MANTMTSTIDFSEALRLMRSGISVKRLAWSKGRPRHHQKLAMQIIDDGKKVRTTFLNYYSDRAVLSMEDILAKDWVELGL